MLKRNKKGGMYMKKMGVKMLHILMSSKLEKIWREMMDQIPTAMMMHLK
jgi:hypothetical protein